MSKYDKTIAISHEEEGSYHRREYEQTPPSSSSRPITTYHTETIKLPADKSGLHRASGSRHNKQLKKLPTSDDSDNDNFQEWTTSKRKVNHKTRQVETRVSRQILVEDGKVIADSGPQVITRIKEDNKVEECEKEKAPKDKGKFEALESASVVGKGEAIGRVLGEKKEVQRVSREVREENMQYHDERFKELTGHDVHRRAIQAPHELITINDKQLSHESRPRGKMVHYSNKGKKYQDTDEILEVAKLAVDGSITKEIKRTKHHEDFSEDEEPDEKGEAEALKQEPIVTRSSRRHVDYVNDFDDTSTPSASEDETDQAKSSTNKHKQNHSRRTHHHHRPEDEAFPRYQIDPLLNSLRDEDFKPMDSHQNRPASATTKHRVIERPSAGYSSQSDDDDDDHRRASRSRNESHGKLRHHQAIVGRAMSRSPSPKHAQVEIPEEYRVKPSKTGGTTHSRQRERSFSPQQAPSKLSHRSSKSHRSGHREDAAVQARLTDEEVERKSIRSSSSSSVVNSHEKTTKHLQRQSNANSSRTYYYGEPKHRARQQQQQQQQQQSKRRDSTSSSASSSICDPKEQLRKQGTRSRDSGFKSPHFGRDSETPQQIYSVSSKSTKSPTKQRSEVISPTPSAGQRSVKTTTTTMSANLEDRPSSRQSTSSKTNTTQPKRPIRAKSGGEKVSKPPSPFQKLAQLFAPSAPKTKAAAS